MLEEAETRSSLRVSGGNVTLLTLWFWDSGLQACDEISVCCFKSPS